jgi:tRNA-Thr(GGU) m(6)t(6)A37 methyltransferase TsaA
MNTKTFELSPIGYIHSPLKERSAAPRQGSEGAPDATIEILPAYIEALHGIHPGQEIWIFTWLHQSERSTLHVHPRSDPQNPLSGVFATRSPDRPNPIGLHLSTVLRIEQENRLHVRNIEAIDGTPVIDIKPAIECTPHR